MVRAFGPFFAPTSAGRSHAALQTIIANRIVLVNKQMASRLLWTFSVLALSVTGFGKGRFFVDNEGST